ncbi:MAG: hypothetical protein GWN67_15555 [Phycisphaerae bacterium]|nr:hypothetical protein [Phycisphaerae bacterium]NIR65776.1 hypothetical protein [candidate division Zixibacteria bacterium]NIP51052.1 hypothetical protein [Phycisphaerae bacterium]NIS52496.1 hypothetical protein [Phycisphaerae bacterium]NIU10031.1 hypothetical protein [Phycisphaerae bacterium]
MRGFSKNLGLMWKIAVLVVICCLGLPVQGKYGGGTGEPNDPYQIADANDLLELGTTTDDYDKHFILIADVNMVGYTFTTAVIAADTDNTNDDFDGIPFTGVFDGAGHRILNLTIDSAGDNYFLGLIGFIHGKKAQVKNLGLGSISITITVGSSSRCLGGLCGRNDGTISNCYSTGSVTGVYGVGGLVGYNSGTISNCYSKASVSGERLIGGLLGNNGGTITNCCSSGSVSGEEDVGGLVGGNRGTITNSYSTNSVSGIHYIGGLVGDNSGGTISNCYSKGSVTGTGIVGGLCGRNRGGTITNCCSTASVSGTESGVGGLVGRNSHNGTITNSYAKGGVSGNILVGGLVGRNYSTITNSYSTGSVTGDKNVGGLVGWNCGTITNCYAAGSVLGGDFVGGLVGENDKWIEYGIIMNCYSTGSVMGNGDIGGLVGESYYGGVIASFWDIETSRQTISDGGTGLSTAEMQTTATFMGWACDPAWTIDEGNDYPRLIWENMTGETISPRLYLYGNGTQAEPYLIYTADQFNMIGLLPCIWDKHFKLMEDIDLSAYSGKSYNIIGKHGTYQVEPYSFPVDISDGFKGVFNGNGHTIANFTYQKDDNIFELYCIGLFGYVDDPNAQIKDLGMINPIVDANWGDYGVASLVGWLNNGTITNCFVEGGSVSGRFCLVGGLVGENKSTITNCYSSGTVTESLVCSGGLVGDNDGTITNCYSTGSVSGGFRPGGLVGYHESGGTISNCYATGKVTGTSDPGGLVGWDHGGMVSDSFWDIETSGQTISDGGTGLPTDQMQTMSTFKDASWDFVGETVNGIEDIWFIPEGDYPHLWWEGMQVLMKLTPSKLNCRSEGNWVKAHLTLPQGFTVADVDSDRLAVLHSFGFKSAPLYVFVNKDKLVEIEAAFERQAVCSPAGDWPQALTVAGFLADGNIFLGTSTVRINHPGTKVIEDLAWYWLNADCVQPDFCYETDMNQDSEVNLLDYALLLNSQVEFISE